MTAFQPCAAHHDFGMPRLSMLGWSVLKDYGTSSNWHLAKLRPLSGSFCPITEASQSSAP